MFGALLRVRREINRERQLPALVRRGRHLVMAEVDDRAEIDRAEVEQYLLARFWIQVELARVPQVLIRRQETPADA